MGIKAYFIKKKINKFRKHHKIGLCLSGGGARGFAHLGAFKAFEEYGIKFDAVAGTSVGSIFSALYASDMKYSEIYEFAKSIKQKDFINQKFGIMPSTMEPLSQTLDKALPYKYIEDLKIPYYAVAVDLKTGKEVDFSSGNLISVITGSCAIPGVFIPVRYKNMNLVDGGVKNNIPADVLFKNGCDYVITIDCNPTRGGGTDSTKFFNQLMTSIGIMIAHNSNQGLEKSSLVISPNMARFSSLKLTNIDEMIDEGYKATIAQMQNIIDIFNGKVK